MQLVGDARVQGVMFTGSTETAKVLQATLAQRLNAHGQVVPLIAETGGQNCMVVDSSALLEQVVTDAVASAFEASGQRCSALRVLCVQDDVADRMLEMLQGAMAEIQMGTPAQLSVDMGPVIDKRAQTGIEAHVRKMQERGCKVQRISRNAPGSLPTGTYVQPTLIEINSIDQLEREVFGPVLHVLRYARQDLDMLLAQINATGYALTLGVHSRIEETITHVIGSTHAGNTYVNRNMVGAVVGVQPFGGEGLSGTGPKAGGPLYLLRLLARSPDDAALRSVQASGATAMPQTTPALQALHNWAAAQGRLPLAHQCARFVVCNPAGLEALLPGPTGERNLYRVQARAQVICRVGTQTNAENELLAQIAAVLAVGGQAVLSSQNAALCAGLPEAVQAQLVVSEALQAEAALISAPANEVLALATQLAKQGGPIVTLTALQPGDLQVPLARLVSERSISTNMAAAGGNASLMTLAG
jgi:RHH-type proline utilization regulon transcriptional repressor/proline dehydrogenase/delta 1-pyrroline-5-carboxylate dehydrogenase